MNRSENMLYVNLFSFRENVFNYRILIHLRAKESYLIIVY